MAKSLFTQFWKANWSTKKAKPHFAQLNIGWNAEPNVPMPAVLEQKRDLLLNFFLNPYVFPNFKDDEKGVLRFENVAKYRLGPTNDEGWYRGQCRYTDVAPKWGEFYELTGPDAQRDMPEDWHVMNDGAGSRHFLFYFRDETFEAFASGWGFAMSPDNALLRLSPGEQE
jgi:hypothetical protein